MASIDTERAPSALDLQHAAAALLSDARGHKPPGGDLTAAERLRWFAAIDRAAKDAKGASDALRRLRDAQHDQVLDALSSMGLARAPLDGGPTIYRSRELWAGYDVPDGATDDEKANIKRAANEGLRGEGLGEYIAEGFNTQSLSAYFRDRERELEDEIRERDGLPADAPVAVDPAELLPENLAGLVRLTERIYPKAKTS